MRWYSALVNDNNDPEQVGRLMVQIPELFGDATFMEWIRPWGAPSGPAAAASWWIPPTGAFVAVVDVGGVLYWSGAVVGGVNTVPPDLLTNYPRRGGSTSPGGQWVSWMDDDDGIGLQPAGESPAHGLRVLVEALAAEVQIWGDAVRLGDANATKALALAEVANANWQALSSLLTTWAVVPGDGGAALKVAAGVLAGTGWPADESALKTFGT